MISTKSKLISWTIILSCLSYSFNTKETEPSPVSFKKSNQKFIDVAAVDIKLADFDGDDDLDAIFVYMTKKKPGSECQESLIWFNDGKGHFDNSGQKLLDCGHGVDIGDLDNDGDIDILIVGNGESSNVYLNNGKGVFHSNQELKIPDGLSVKLSDIDRDNDLDAFISAVDNPVILWLNDGNGRFSQTDIQFKGVADIGDVDNDGDIDILTKAIGHGYNIKLNDGKANFLDGWELVDSTASYGAMGLRDLDQDGDLDMFITNGNFERTYPSQVFFNDGNGNFADSGQLLGHTRLARLRFADLNNDGKIDVFISNRKHPDQVYLNNGKGYFSENEPVNKEETSTAGSALADLDNDKDIDILMCDLFKSCEIWLNELNNSK